MKYLTLFFIGIILGTALVALYVIPEKNKKKQALVMPIPNGPKVFSFDEAPLNSLKGTVSAMDGPVEWQSRTATTPASLEKSILIQQQENVETELKGTITIDFPGVARVALLPETAVSFIQTLPANIVVSQSKGEGVYTKLGTTTPVSVRILHLLVTVDGQVDISLDKDKTTITINVMKGTAMIGYNDNQNITQEIVINKGEVGIFDDNTASFIKR